MKRKPDTVKILPKVKRKQVAERRRKAVVDSIMQQMMPLWMNRLRQDNDEGLENEYELPDLGVQDQDVLIEH